MSFASTFSPDLMHEYNIGINEAGYHDLVSVMRTATIEADRKDQDTVKLAILYSIAARFYREEALRCKHVRGLSQVAKRIAKEYEDKVIAIAEGFETDARVAHIEMLLND